jgi:antitoxin (DNA-binding transcriptional repressor) of toxin-antitoxin stability system
VQHNFAKILRLVEDGHDVLILRRNVPVARLVGEHKPGDPTDHPDFVQRARLMWGEPEGASLSDLVLADRAESDR